MAHVPGTFTRTDWKLIDNPDYGGRAPTPLKAACHDGSPFITIKCNHCGEGMHHHETSVAHVPADAEIASRCPTCSRLLVFPPGFFADAFAQLRAEGWVAE